METSIQTNNLIQDCSKNINLTKSIKNALLSLLTPARHHNMKCGGYLCYHLNFVPLMKKKYTYCNVKMKAVVYQYCC